MIVEAEHTFWETHPEYIIVELTDDNWSDVVEWSKAEECTEPTGGRWLCIPNGDYDSVLAKVGDHIVRQGPYWIAYTAEEWGEPGDEHSIVSQFTQDVPEKERIAEVIAFIYGETDRVTPCSKHPMGHRKMVGEQPYEDLEYIRETLKGGPQQQPGGLS